MTRQESGPGTWPERRTGGYRLGVRDGEWVRFGIRFEVLGAPTMWCDAPIAAVTEAG